MRLRLALSLALLALVAIILLALGLSAYFSAKEEEFIDELLAQQLDYSIDIWRRSPDAAFPHTPSMWLYRIGRDGVPADVPPTFADLAPGKHEVYLGDREYHVAVRAADDARFILAYDVEDHETRVDSLLLVTAVTACALALLTLLAGYLLAGRLSRPLERLAGRLAGDDPQTFVESGMEEELHVVASALDAYRQRQRLTLERERAFAANLSHELRTPLAGIRSDAELIGELPDQPEAAIRRSQRIIDSVDRIDHLSSALLMLAREAVPAAHETVTLRARLETVWEQVLAARPKEVRFANEVDGSLKLLADPALLEPVLRNVLDNALRHSDGGRILARCEDSRLSIVDSGPGFAPEELERIFDRFYIGRRGDNGIGLALVRHICSACGWQVRARNVEGGGEIIIDFGDSVACGTGIADAMQNPAVDR